MVIVGGTTIVRASRLLSLHERALSWPTVSGVVLASALREQTDGEGTSYRAEITCGYSVAGTDYATSRHTEGTDFARPEQSARALVAAFPAGKAVEVSVDPADATNAVLLTGKPAHMIVIRRIGVAAALAGVALATYGLMQSG